MDTLSDTRPSDVDEAESPARRTRCRPIKLAIATTLVVPVAAVAGAWALFFTPGSPPALELSPNTGEAAGGVPSGLWSVGEGSVAGYRVWEKLLRLPAWNDGVGRTTAVTGAFRLSRDRSALRVEAGMRVDVDVSELKSDEDRRDDHMRTMTIETDLFPTASFVTTSDILLPPELISGGAASVTVPGDLTIHGVTRAVAIPLRAQHTGGRIEVVGP